MPSVNSVVKNRGFTTEDTEFTEGSRGVAAIVVGTFAVFQGHAGAMLGTKTNFVGFETIFLGIKTIFMGIRTLELARGR